ncbi:MAG: hypothetical protein H6625_10850 [Bdellovibrionaceae bacterium]|nr:hypothetical protein [Pseudobdellovibrionaceae bacterium]
MKEIMPTPNDFSQWPIEIARSKAIEALIQQNDDLMARLSVQLRRISTIEVQLNQSRQEKEALNYQYENLKDQLLILKQKAQALSQRKDNSEGVVKALRDQAKRLGENLQVSEIRYAELYQTHEDKQKQLLNRIDQHARRVRRFLNYRERIKKASRNIKENYINEISEIQRKKAISEHNLTQELNDIKKKLTSEHELTLKCLQEESSNAQQKLIKDKIEVENQLLEKIHQLEEKNSTLKKQLDHAETTLKELREKLAESTSYIQQSNKSHVDEIEKLNRDNLNHIQRRTQQHEVEVNELKKLHQEKSDSLVKEIEKLQRENQKLFDKCTELEKVYEENIQLQNKIVFVERNRDEQRNKYQDEVELLQRNLSHYRADSKSKSSELESVKIHLQQTEQVNQQLKEEKLRLEDQVEGVQSLWRETQKELETLKEKNFSLQKLNQQLSANINQGRKDHRNLKEKFDFLHEQMNQKVKELRRNSDTLTSIREIEKGHEELDFSPQLAEKLETLIAEIQSGFIKR